MDRLYGGQQLGTGEELVSPNGWLRLIMQADGNLVLYRTQTMQPLWASDTWGQDVATTVMQTDGNLVAYSPQGVPAWATGTDGHAGAYVILQDDGNLVVYDAANSPLWASDTVQNESRP